MYRISLFLTTLFTFSILVSAQETRVYDFSADTADANNISVNGPGFDTLPLADVSFGQVPANNAFDDATDGQGVVVTAEPGEGAMIFTESISTPNAALIRCNVRMDSAAGSITVGAVGKSGSVDVPLNSPAGLSEFDGKWRQVSVLFVPPGTGFDPFVQVFNPENSGMTVKFYIDNFAIHLLSPGKYYSGEFLNSDGDEPETISIDQNNSEPTATPTPGGGSGDIITVPLPNLPANAKPLEMVYIETGTFMMGSPSDERGRDWDEGPQHQVTLSQGFYMGKYEVTQAQFEAVMGENPARSFGVGDDYPVYYVSWYDAARFCNRLSEMEGLQPVYTESGDWPANMNANGYRLPTEAEWEYACRAGTQTRFSHGDALECSDECGSCDLHDQYMVWCGNDSGHSEEVGTKLPNSWGLHDMHGNVWEWCTDWYDNDYYYRSPEVDPVNIQTNQFRVLRGGVWSNFAWICRSAIRLRLNPSGTDYNGGFRVCRTQ